MLDRYTWGNASRVSPEAPVLVLRAEEEEVRLGGAASVACLLRHLGARVTLAGVVGDDPGGRTVRRLMDEILSPADSGRPTQRSPVRVQ
jgi:D-beta-D-heptose 7-phosphate kinase / D-beta-D-heptose 1-phosphate adenosyltransferase